MNPQVRPRRKTGILKNIIIAGSVVVIAVVAVVYGQSTLRENRIEGPQKQNDKTPITGATTSQNEVKGVGAVVLLIQVHAGFSPITGAVTKELALFNNNTYAWKEIRDPKATSQKEIEYLYKSGSADSAPLGALLETILSESAAMLVDDASILTVEYVGSNGERVVKTYYYASQDSKAGEILQAVTSIVSSSEFKDGQASLCEQSGGDWVPRDSVSPEYCNWRWQ